eukprot:1262841-Pyramimonas_sp.AAC.1
MFSSSTAVGPGRFRPRRWALVSNGGLSLLWYTMHLCESWGVWPTLMQNTRIVLLAEPTGGSRPIALLSS